MLFFQTQYFFNIHAHRLHGFYCFRALPVVEVGEYAGSTTESPLYV